MMDIINGIINYIPEKYRGLVTALALSSPLLTRAFYALKNGGGIKGVISAIWLGTNAPKEKPAAPSEPSNISRVLLLGFVCGALFLVTGCQTANLEAGGAYAQPGFAPDRAFYEVEAGFDLAYSSVLAAMKFERDNRAFLWSVSHDIKNSMDKARPVIVQVTHDYALARKLYLANPTPEGLTQLQLVFQKMQAVNAAAAAVVNQYNKK